MTYEFEFGDGTRETVITDHSDIVSERRGQSVSRPHVYHSGEHCCSSRRHCETRE